VGEVEEVLVNIPEVEAMEYEIAVDISHLMLCTLLLAFELHLVEV
jgi:hypothetical protein